MLLKRWRSMPHNAFAEAVDGHTRWTVAEQLLAIIGDVLEWANWQRIGKRHAPKPKRIPRPWEDNSQRLGRDPIPVSQFDAWWDEKTAEAAKRPRPTPPAQSRRERRRERGRDR